MKSSVQKSNFGLLLESYRRERKFTQLKLERMLNQEGYPITNGLISKYANGKIDPPPDFVCAVAIHMDLSQEEADALINAHLADVSLRFWKKYKELSLQT